MPDSSVVTYDKEGFIAHFRKQAEEGKTRLNTWVDWHDFHVLGDSAVCVLTRRHSGIEQCNSPRTRFNEAPANSPGMDGMSRVGELAVRELQ